MEGGEEGEAGDGGGAGLWVRLRAVGVRLAGVESGLRRMKMESMKPHAWEGPMPHSVVTTRGRKALPRAWQPAACFGGLVIFLGFSFV